MPAEPPTSERQITGDDIIAEILRNAEASLFRMRRTIIVPSVFNIYLHPADFDLISPVLKALKTETKQALKERVEDLNDQTKPNKVAKFLGFANGEETSYKILDPDYTIEFYPDAESTLTRGDIEVRSELASAARPEFDGAMTRHVTRKQGTISYAEPAGTADQDATQPVHRSKEAEKLYGYLRYTDAGNSLTFPITRDEIVIGRGGKTVWVDLRLNAPPDVSREHCRIRRDAATGRFYLSDYSQFGTSLDGRRIPTSTAGKPVETQLPTKATITLADVVSLEFEASE